MVDFKMNGNGHTFATFVLTFLFTLHISTASAQRNDIETVHYTLSVDEKDFEHFIISLRIQNHRGGNLTLSMPHWSPGSYRMRDYAQNVRNLRAYDDDGGSLPVLKIDEHSWRIEQAGKSVRVEYTVEPAYEPWSRGGLDSTYALVEGPSTFLYVKNKRDTPVSVTYKLPTGWKMATPLRSATSTNTFYADNYDDFIDSPAQMGQFQKLGFLLDDVSIELIVHGRSRFSADSLVWMVKQICRYQTELFQELPVNRYLFFYNLLPGNRSGGGLEHANSTSIGLAGERLARDILSAAEVTAHEFFHLWNVKRIRPEIFTHYDYSRAARCRSLWFVEGVTSYYEALTLLRSSLWEQTEFIEEMERQIEILQETNERKQISVEDASWFTWERGYAHNGVSYYNKGELLGLLLDLKIRQLTENRVSLDEVMIAMNERFGKKQQGYRPGDILATINELCEGDLTGFFANYVSGTEELPYPEVLQYAGMEVSLHSRWMPSVGGLLLAGRRNRVISVEQGSPLTLAGLKRRDFLLKANGVNIVSMRQFYALVRKQKIGAEMQLRILRGKRFIDLILKIGKRERVQCEIEAVENPTKRQLQIRQGWLQGRTRRVERMSQ
ncbi:MAG: M61 family metallopeptidase [bacterium]